MGSAKTLSHVITLPPLDGLARFAAGGTWTNGRLKTYMPKTHAGKQHFITPIFLPRSRQSPDSIYHPSIQPRPRLVIPFPLRSRPAESRWHRKKLFKRSAPRSHLFFSPSLFLPFLHTDSRPPRPYSARFGRRVQSSKPSHFHHFSYHYRTSVIMTGRKYINSFITIGCCRRRRSMGPLYLTRVCSRKSRDHNATSIT